MAAELTRLEMMVRLTSAYLSNPHVGVVSLTQEQIIDTMDELTNRLFAKVESYDKKDENEYMDSVMNNNQNRQIEEQEYAEEVHDDLDYEDDDTIEEIIPEPVIKKAKRLK